MSSHSDRQGLQNILRVLADRVEQSLRRPSGLASDLLPIAQRAEFYAQLVEKARGIIEAMGARVLSAAETRDRLKLR